MVPVVHALLQVDNFRALATLDGLHVGIRFPFPAPLLDLWSFANVPNPEGGAISLFGFGPLWLFPLFLVIEVVLIAGYIGSLDDLATTGSYDFRESVRTYFGQFLVYQLVVALPLVVFVVGLFGGITTGRMGAGVGLVLLSVPVFFVASYLFYAAPFLIVIEDCTAVDAFVRSFRLALDGGAYAEYFFKRLVVGAALSIPVTLVVVVNLGLVGGILGTVFLALVGFAFTFATHCFLREHVDIGSEPEYLVPLP